MRLSRPGFVQTGFILVATLITSAVLISFALLLGHYVSADGPISINYAPNFCSGNNVPVVLNWSPNTNQNILVISESAGVLQAIGVTPDQASATASVPSAKNLKYQVGSQTAGAISGIFNETDSQSPACQNQTPPPSAQPSPVSDFPPPNGLTENQFCEPNPDDKPTIIAFTWQASPGAKSYRVYVEDKASQNPSNNLRPGQLVHNTGDTWLDFPGDGNTQTWFVRAYATEDGNDNGPHADSLKKNFNTRTDCKNLQPPAVPQGLGVRASCSSLGQHTLTLFWNAVEGTTGYRVAVMGDSGQLSERDVPGTAVEIPPPPPDIKYSWKVKAYKDFQGQRLESAYTDTREITLQIIDCPTPIPTPTPTPPPTPSPTQVPTPTPTPTPTSQPTSSPQPTTSPQPTSSPSPVSTPVASTAPQCPNPQTFNLLAPNNETNSAQPTFKWVKSAGAIRYFLELSDSNFQTYWDLPVSKDSLQNESVYSPWPGSWGSDHAAGKPAPQELESQKTYQWRVRAINECINASQNTQGTFISSINSIVYKKPVGPRNIEPATPNHVENNQQKANNFDGIDVQFTWKTSPNSQEIDQQWLYLKFKQGGDPNHSNSVNLGPFDKNVVATDIKGDNSSPGLLEDREYTWTIDTTNPAVNYIASLAKPDSFKTLKKEEASPVPSPSPKPGQEICGNNIDDNNNGQIDENCPPQKPILTQPEPDFAYGAGSTTVFSWRNSGQVDYSWVDVSQSSNFDKWWGCQTTNTNTTLAQCGWVAFKQSPSGADLDNVEVPKAFPNGQYFWRVTSINQFGKSQSPVQKFTVGQPLPSPSPSQTPSPIASPTPSPITSPTPSPISSPSPEPSQSSSPTPQASELPSPPPSPNPQNCILNNATWSTDIATEGAYVNLTVSGSSECNGKEVRFEIFEDDNAIEGFGDDNVQIQPAPAIFINGQAQSSWYGEYQEDGIGGVFDPPEFYFRASTETSQETFTEIRSSNPLLKVFKSCSLISASWSSERVDEGQNVTLNVKGNYACSDMQIAFLVMENDSVLEGGGDDDVKVNPVNVKFPPKVSADPSSGPLPPIITASASWVAEYQEDGIGGVFDPPEYYFKVNLVGTNITLRSADPLLKVTKKAPTPEASPTPSPFIAPRGISGDLWADTVIGQKDFTQINPGQIVSDKVFNPGGVVVDKFSVPQGHPGRAYVWDSGNNRILGIDLQRCYAQAASSRCSADIVIGQNSINDDGACNRDSSFQSYPQEPPASASTLCGVSPNNFTLVETKSFSGMFVDSSGNLYVPDTENHRVLKYNNPFTNDSIADEIWGQSNFEGHKCNQEQNPAASSLCSTRYWTNGTLSSALGITLDSAGNLWVADQGNNRILRFPKNQSTGIISKTADLVLGQSDFTSNFPGSDMGKLTKPSAITFDNNGNLYIADTGNYRVLMFQPPFMTGMSASKNFGSGFDHLDAYKFGSDPNPWDIKADPLGRGIWTLEGLEFGMRARLWSFNGSAIIAEFQGNSRGGGSLGFDTKGAVLVTSYYDHELSRFTQTGGSYTLDRKFFSPPSGMNLTSGSRFEHTAHGGIAIAGNQLFAGDSKRILYWNNTGGLTNGKSADGYIDPNSYSFRAGPFDQFLNDGTFFTYVKSSVDGKIWVAKRDKIIVYQAPVGIGTQPTKVIEPVINILGGGQINLSNQPISSLAPSSDNKFLWISQTSQHRVLRIRNPLSTSPLVDVVLGQKDLTSTYCNGNPNDPANNDNYANPDINFAKLDTLCYPGALSTDKKGNLYVSDHFHEISGNKRLLVFSSTTFPDSPSTIIFSPAATKEFPTSLGFATWEPAFDSSNRMVVGYNPYSGKTGKFVEYFDDPTSSSVIQSGSLKDYNGWPVAMTFDPQDNLYIFDVNRAQIRIYKKPFQGSTLGTQDSKNELESWLDKIGQEISSYLKNK